MNTEKESIPEWEARINSMGIDELTAIREQINREILDIGNALDSARAKRIQTGEYSDAGWYARATMAKRIKGFQVQKLSLALKRLQKEQLKGRAVEFQEAFMQAARRQLSSEQLREIISEAHTIVSEHCTTN